MNYKDTRDMAASSESDCELEKQAQAWVVKIFCGPPRPEDEEAFFFGSRRMKGISRPTRKLKEFGLA